MIPMVRSRTHLLLALHLTQNAAVVLCPRAVCLVELSTLAGTCLGGINADTVLVWPPLELADACCAADSLLWTSIGAGIGLGDGVGLGDGGGVGGGCGSNNEEDREELHFGVFS